ncbi:MAG TPA: TPM domain-containing protein [Ideonella sp.]|uniref:TPM domain-containing protein n=1 Tax=Ideonella sp. TaxID=1929293 RepID=UPI002C413B74|nr:TPM domain-containing protein [Ideonella sp.]HSI46678.1 TPM domain-containing protein [Ideonella sp.]
MAATLRTGSRLLRLLKHRRWDETDARRLLPPAALQALAAQVTASEAGHSGEIRICVEAGLPLSYLWRRASARERAIAMFGKLRVWDTEHNNGVLVYLLLAERTIELVADRGLSRQVDDATWARIVAGLREALGQGQWAPGLGHAVAEIDALLRQHFPLTGERQLNELPDAVVILG